MQEMLRCEYGGMNEVLADLYADTGDARYLALSRRFHDQRGARTARRRRGSALRGCTPTRRFRSWSASPAGTS